MAAGGERTEVRQVGSRRAMRRLMLWSRGRGWRPGLLDWVLQMSPPGIGAREA